MVCYIIFLVLCSLLAFFLGVAKKKEPLIVIDEDWKYLSTHQLEEAIDYFVNNKHNLNKDIIWRISDSYKISFAVERYERSKRNYENCRCSSDLQGFFGFIFLCAIYLAKTALPFWVTWLSVILNIFLSVVVYQVTVKFYERNLSKDIVYVEYAWSAASPTSPEEFDKCNEFLKEEKIRCVDRLNARADAYEMGLYFKKYHLNTFRWASVLGVALLSAIIFGFLFQ